jgi:hypothetical protein
MGTVAQHQTKAEHHRQFLATVPDSYPDWMATVAFYTAVELVEALAALKGSHSTSHETRKRFVRQNHPRIAREFHTLYNASLDARYEPKERWIDAEQVKRELLGKCLTNVTSYVASRMAKAETGPTEDPAV